MENKVVSEYYNENVYTEWNRLKEHKLEFLFTVSIMEQHVKKGDRILDIGGGPGQYSLHFAAMECDVTLLDISENELIFAENRARENGLKIRTIHGDCTEPYLEGEKFDHIFLMGPLYHLKDDRLQKTAVERALKHLKADGLLYCSFITNMAGVIHDLKYGPGRWMKNSKQDCETLVNAIVNDVDYIGKSFTECRFMSPRSVLRFMKQFELEQVHFFGQESIFAFNELQMNNFPEDELKSWIETGKKLLEIPEVVAASENVMYVGKKGEL